MSDDDFDFDFDDRAPPMTREYKVGLGEHAVYVVLDPDGGAWRASVRAVRPDGAVVEVEEITGGRTTCINGGLMAAAGALDALADGEGI
jgi:hypothetical protein